MSAMTDEVRCPKCGSHVQLGVHDDGECLECGAFLILDFEVLDADPDADPPALENTIDIQSGD